MYRIIKKIFIIHVVLVVCQSSFSQIIWENNIPYILHDNVMCELTNINFHFDTSYTEYSSNKYILIKEIYSSSFSFQGMSYDTIITNVVYAKPLFDGSSHKFKVIGIDSLYERDVLSCYLIHVRDATILPDSVKKITSYTIVSMCENVVDDTLPHIIVGDILSLILVPLEKETECYCRPAYDSWVHISLKNKYFYIDGSIRKYCLVSTENINGLHYIVEGY